MDTNTMRVRLISKREAPLLIGVYLVILAVSTAVVLRDPKGDTGWQLLVQELLAGVVAVLVLRRAGGRLTWDAHGLRGGRGRRAWEVAWADIADVELLPSGPGLPAVELRQRDGQSRLVVIGYCGPEGDTLYDALVAYAQPLSPVPDNIHLASPLGDHPARFYALHYAVAAMLALTMGGMLLLPWLLGMPGQTQPAQIALGLIVMAFTVIACAALPHVQNVGVAADLTAEGVRWSTRRGDQWLPWHAVERVVCRYTGADLRLRVSGAGQSVRLVAAGPDAMATLRRIAGRAVNAVAEDRSLDTGHPWLARVLAPYLGAGRRRSGNAAVLGVLAGVCGMLMALIGAGNYAWVVDNISRAPADMAKRQELAGLSAAGAAALCGVALFAWMRFLSVKPPTHRLGQSALP